MKQLDPTVGTARMVAVGTVLLGTYFLLPSFLAELYYLLFGPAVGVALLVASRRAPAPHAWRLLGCGTLLFGAGDVLWTVEDQLATGGIAFPSVADVLYLAGYVALAGGMLVLLRHRLPGRDLSSLLDAGVLSVAVGLVLWVYVMEPMAEDHSLALSARLVAIAYPLGDLVLLALSVRLLFGGGARPERFRLLVAAMLVMVVADSAYALLTIRDGYVTGSWLDGAWILAYLLCGTLAWRPDQGDFHDDGPRVRAVGSGRIVLLALATLIAPAVLGIQAHAGEDLHLHEVIAASSALFLLVVARLAGLVREMQHLAMRDPLTGLPNRAFLEQRLPAALEAADRSGTGVAVLFVDLDRFKLVNDLLGHAGGDQLLQAVADRMRAELRSNDLLVRYAGDEFVVLVERGDPEHAVSLANRLVAALAEPLWVEGAPVVPTASVGIALSAPGQLDADALVRDADAAMFRAKLRPDVHHELFDVSMRDLSPGTFELEAALRSSQNERFEVHFQPIMRAGDLEVVAFEALVRWRTEDGLLLPGEFLLAAEHAGVGSRIASLVLAASCAFGEGWRGSNAEPARMFVNLSARDLADPQLGHGIRAALASSGFDPAFLLLEVSERTLDDDASMAALHRLSEMGLALALDDLGSGTSALPRIRDCAFRVLKLDRSLVHGIAANPRERAIVHGIVTIAADLGIELIAEGVEDPADLEVLQSLGCGLVQGFLLARPAPAAAWLQHLPANR